MSGDITNLPADCGAADAQWVPCPGCPSAPGPCACSGTACCARHRDELDDDDGERFDGTAWLASGRPMPADTPEAMARIAEARARIDAENAAGHFTGHEDRECGEHRTVGAHRAWCHECGEWCYPRIDAACKGCELPALRARLAAGTVEALVEAVLQQVHASTLPDGSIRELWLTGEGPLVSYDVPDLARLIAVRITGGEP